MLRAWRTLAPGVAGHETVHALARALGQLDAPDRGRHLDALIDPAAAVALGIDVLHGRPIESAETDMAMSVLLSHALRGDATAPVVLAHGLTVLACGHPERDRLVQLSEGWSRRKR